MSRSIELQEPVAVAHKRIAPRNIDLELDLTLRIERGLDRQGLVVPGLGDATDSALVSQWIGMGRGRMPQTLGRNGKRLWLCDSPKFKDRATRHPEGFCGHTAVAIWRCIEDGSIAVRLP